MSTAVAFKMPVPHVGQAVLFYPRAIVNKSTRVLGYVLSTNPHCIELTVRGVVHEGVRHVDDPELVQNKHCREFGCWAPCPWDANQEKRIAALESSVEDLTARLRFLESQALPSRSRQKSSN